MTCREIEEGAIAEAYLLGRLTEAERDAFEAHYFECARCYSEVQALRDVREALRAQRQPAAPRWAWAAVAATLLVAASSGLLWRAAGTRPSAPPPAAPVASGQPPRTNVDEMARLAAVTPPPFSPSRLRSGGAREAFTSGAARYSAGDYAAAIPLFERALTEEPRAEDVRFYLGASRLLTGDADAAISTLEPLAGRPESPYAEESRFLIGKAHLRAGRVTEASAAFDRTVAMHGDRERDAAAIVARLRALAPASAPR